MTSAKAKEIVESLAKGIDYETGEVLPSDSILNRGEVVRALYTCLDGLELLLKKENKLQEDIKNESLSLAKNQYHQKMVDFANHIKQDISNFVNSMISEDKSLWNISALDEFCAQNQIDLPITFVDYVANNPNISKTELLDHFTSQILEIFSNSQVTRFERGILLQHIDYYWRDHLTALEQLRQGIHLRGYAQKDPKQEYKHESFNLFSNMLDNIKRDAAKTLLIIEIQGVNNIPQQSPQKQNMLLNHVDTDDAKEIIGRNSPCACGSGKKYKHCCGKLI